MSSTVLLCFRQFLRSPNFVGWYTVRREEANQKLRLIHLDMLCKAVSSMIKDSCCLPPIKDVFFWMKDKQEIEIVDFLLQVKQCIVSFSHISRDLIVNNIYYITNIS